MFNASFVTLTKRSSLGRALVSGRDSDARLAEHTPPGECFARHAQGG
jgi:hypothetical protein